MDLVQLQSQIEFSFRVKFLAATVFILKKFLGQFFFEIIKRKYLMKDGKILKILNLHLVDISLKNVGQVRIFKYFLAGCFGSLVWEEVVPVQISCLIKMPRKIINFWRILHWLDLDSYFFVHEMLNTSVIHFQNKIFCVYNFTSLFKAFQSVHKKLGIT